MSASLSAANSFPERFGNDENNGEKITITWNKTSETPQDDSSSDEHALRSTTAAAVDAVTTVPPDEERNSSQPLVLLIASLANLGISFNVVRFVNPWISCFSMPGGTSFAFNL